VTGARSHHAGKAAEEIVERHYTAQGYACLARRWRAPAGEIDLVCARGDVLVFVEVKASATLDRALANLGPRQIARITAAAESFPDPGDAAVPMNRRIDLAAVDGTGQVAVVENITL